MRLRLLLAAVIIVAGALALAVLRLTGQQPAAVATGMPTAAVAVASPAAAATPVASDTPAATPQPAATPSDVTVVASATATTTATATASPTATPEATPNPNLLAMRNGTFVRRWTAAGVQDDPQGVAAEESSAALTPRFTKPVELLFEMPSVAHIDRIGVTLRGKSEAHVDVAVGTGPHALHRIGTVPLALPADSDSQRFIEVGADARFVQFTIVHATTDDIRLAAVTASGTRGPFQRGRLFGTWVTNDSLGRGGVPGVELGHIPDTLPAAAGLQPRYANESGGILAYLACGYRGDTWRGAVRDNVARVGQDQLQLAGNGNLLVGSVDGRAIVAFRSAAPACAPFDAGTGTPVLALMRVMQETAPEIDPATFPGYRFAHRFVPTLSAQLLAHANFAILDGDCQAVRTLSLPQQQMLMQWVSAGHKLIVRDSDVCSASDYSFIPFRFVTVATGATGARGKVLVNADPSTLGSGPEDRVHHIDVDAYLASTAQQVGDADIIKTDDPHWCGHLFSRNAVGANGWVHAYARYGRGLIIYDGFDRDDLQSRIPDARRVVQLEYAQPVQAELPCNARVAAKLVVFPSVTKTLPAGTPVVLRVPMGVAYTAKDAAAQDVDLSIAGDTKYPGRVTPGHVNLAAGAGAPLTATVNLPAGWSGRHAYTVSATGPLGATATATLTIDGSLALAKAFESQRRVRIYGIYFDVASANIQPRSEATIEQIAQVLNAHPDWKMRVEGHTDSDGGTAYNAALSVRRANSVVGDLVARYHIARTRLTPAGFGLTRPVASNATEAGKALNRRVELVRL